jgi:hypothetical protein
MQNTDIVKNYIIELVKRLPDSETIAVQKFIEFLLANADDPMLRLLFASRPVDEPLTDEEKAASEAGWQAYLRGEGESWDVVREEIAHGEEK